MNNKSSSSSNHHNSRHNATRSRAMRSRDRGRGRSPRADESRAQSSHHDSQTPGLRSSSRESLRADSPRRLPDGIVTIYLSRGREVLVQGLPQGGLSLVGVIEDMPEAVHHSRALLGDPENLGGLVAYVECCHFNTMPLWRLAENAHEMPPPPAREDILSGNFETPERRPSVPPGEPARGHHDGHEAGALGDYVMRVFVVRGQLNGGPHYHQH